MERSEFATRHLLWRYLMFFKVRVLKLSELLLEYTGSKDDDVAAIVAATKAQADMAFA
jgi:hypothetical protein